MAYQDPQTAYYGQGKNIISSSTKGSWLGFNPISSHADFGHKQEVLSLRRMMSQPSKSRDACSLPAGLASLCLPPGDALPS